MSYPCRCAFDAGRGHSRYGRQRPKARPIQTGTGTQSRWLPWSRSRARPDRGRADEGSRLSYQDSRGIGDSSSSNKRTIQGRFRGCI